MFQAVHVMPNRRILLIDDNRDILSSFKLGLRRQGFDVEAYDNPISAIRDYSPEKFDLVITDIRMPALSGFEVARAILAKDGNAKIVFMTAFEVSSTEFSQLFRDVKISDFIQKPASLSEVKKKIEAVLCGSISH
jgi:DNA-binding response OmpR family regulator